MTKRRKFRNGKSWNGLRHSGTSATTEFLRPSYSELKILKREVWSEESDLDEAVWSRGLPDDVYCTILAHLPLSSFAQLRTVCKRWNLMPKDKSFLEACSRVQSRTPSLLVMDPDRDNCWTYEPAMNCWKAIPLSLFKPQDSHAPTYVVSSSGGVMLLLRRFQLLFYNPLNNSVKLLHPMLDMEHPDLPTLFEVHVIGMFVNADGASDAINILVMNKRTNADEDLDSDYGDYGSYDPFVSQVYDSRADSWKMIMDFEPLFNLSITSVAMAESKLRCVTSSCKWNPRFSHLAIYSVEANAPDAWEKEKIRMPNEGLPLVSPHLFTYRGKLMMVAALPTNESRNDIFPVWNNVIVWKQSTSSTPYEKDGHWDRVMEIGPKDLNTELWNTSLDSFFFLSGGNFIYFGSRSGSSLGMINLKAQTWRLLPSFPGITSLFGKSIERMNFQTFLFEPRFDVVV